NTISGNTGAGVFIEKADGTVVIANNIGTNKVGSLGVGNGQGGVIVGTTAKNTTIGGGAASLGNLISGNSGANGIQVQTSASSTVIQGNTIGFVAGGTQPLPNSIGIVVQDRASSTTIGGSTAGSGNIIGFNDLSGINVRGTPTSTVIQGNRIGLATNG